MNKYKNIIINKLDTILINKHRKTILFTAALIDSLIGIIPTDFIVMYFFIRAKKPKIITQSLLIAFGSVWGSLFLYYTSSLLTTFIPQILHSTYYTHISEILNYSLLIQFILIIFISFVGTIPFILLSILLGIFNIQLLIYIPAIFIGRFLRFSTIATLSKKYGITMIKTLNKYSLNITFGIIAFVIGYLYYLIIH